MLQEIIKYLESNPAPEKKGNPRSPHNLSINAYNDFIKQLRGWLQTRQVQLKEKDNKLNEVNTEKIKEETVAHKTVAWDTDVFLKLLHQLTDINGKGY